MCPPTSKSLLRHCRLSKYEKVTRRPKLYEFLTVALTHTTYHARPATGDITCNLIADWLQIYYIVLTRQLFKDTYWFYRHLFPCVGLLCYISNFVFCSLCSLLSRPIFIRIVFCLLWFTWHLELRFIVFLIKRICYVLIVFCIRHCNHVDDGCEKFERWTMIFFSPYYRN